MIFTCTPTDGTGNPHHLCLISYRIPKGFKPKVGSHGNDKTSKPFFPTLPSTKLKIRSQSKECGPKQILGVVSKWLGGVQNASSPCDLSRNERQCSYIRSTSTNRSSSQSGACDPLADQVYAIMQSAKMSDCHGPFVRETRPSFDQHPFRK